MKQFLAAMLFTSSVAFASESVILDVPARDLGSFDRIESRLNVDFDSGSVSAIISSSKIVQDCRWQFRRNGGGRGRRQTVRYKCYNTSQVVNELSAPIENMMVIDDSIILRTEQGELDCGFIKSGRIFKKTKKIILNGNCTIDSRLIKVQGEKRAQLLLITK